MRTVANRKLADVIDDILTLLNSTEVGSRPLLQLTPELRCVPTTQPPQVLCSYVLDKILAEFASIWNFPPVKDSNVERIRKKLLHPTKELLAVMTSDPIDGVSVLEKLAHLVLGLRAAMQNDMQAIQEDLPCEVK